MKQKLAIYLAGTIKKEHENLDESFWTEEDMRILSDHLPEFDVSYLNPALRSDDLSDQFSVFGRDMLQVFCSDIVFVDARERRGLGVGAEMMWAKLNKIPVIVWAPQDTHYHKSNATVLGVPVANYVHPFVASLSDAMVRDMVEGAHSIRALRSNPQDGIKGREHIEAAMKHYQSTQLENDEPMQQIINTHDALRHRIQHRLLSLY
jgi:hypothetical protein